MVLRLMGDGIDFHTPDGIVERRILNSPEQREEYQEFRRRVLHLAWLQTNRQLFVAPLVLEGAVRAALRFELSPSEQLGALERGWRRVDALVYELNKPVLGRTAITNYDPRRLSDAERSALNARGTAEGRNEVLVDIRPEYPGGNFPFSGTIRLRSFNLMLGFLARGIEDTPEVDVTPDPRTGPVRGRSVRNHLLWSGFTFGHGFGGFGALPPGLRRLRCDTTGTVIDLPGDANVSDWIQTLPPNELEYLRRLDLA